MAKTCKRFLARDSICAECALCPIAVVFVDTFYQEIRMGSNGFTLSSVIK